MSTHAPVRRNTIKTLTDKTQQGQKWAMLTAYDALTAALIEEAGIEALLVGDSAGGLILGYDTTIPVTLDDIISMSAAVTRATHKPLIVADMPFGTYEESPQWALQNAVKLMKQGGVGAVKLEGGEKICPQIEKLTQSGIPVIGHIGLTPQSVHQLGGYRVQGKTPEHARKLLEDAKALEQAAASMIVLEAIPADLAERITQTVGVPTIGIGAGAGTSAQILVWQDLVGLTPEPRPRFVKPYLNLRQQITQAIQDWARDVAGGTYPGEEQTYH